MKRPIVKLLAIALPAVFAMVVLALNALPRLSSAAALFATGSIYYVSPSGSDSNNGTSAGAPFKTIQKGLDVAQAGDTITLAPGTYLQDFATKRPGAAGAPITVTGPANAIVKGGGNARIAQINHGYTVLSGFAIDGQYSSGSYREKLIYVQGIEARTALEGIKLQGLTLGNAGGECVRLRYYVQRAEIANNTIGPCGRNDFPNGTWAGGAKNGEGTYIGTAPEQRADGKNPDASPDLSNGNWVHNNAYNTQGNECVDIKEAATANIVEYNTCTGQKDPNSAGFDSRGSGNTFRYNEVFDNIGAGVRLGGDTASDGTQNVVVFNNMHDNKAGGIKLQNGPQAEICGNTMSNNSGGDAVGSFSGQYKPAKACDSSPQSQQPTATQPAPPTATATAEPTSPAPVPTTAPAPAGDSLLPVADTYVRERSPNKRYGSSASLKVDGTPNTWTLLRFQVPSGSPVKKATLKLYVNDGSGKGGRIVTVDGAWDENTTWNTRPALGGQVAELGRVRKGRYVTIDVTSAIRADGTLSLAIQPNSDDAATYKARETGEKYRPRLLIER